MLIYWSLNSHITPNYCVRVIVISTTKRKTLIYIFFFWGGGGGPMAGF